MSEWVHGGVRSPDCTRDSDEGYTTMHSDICGLLKVGMLAWVCV